MLFLSVTLFAFSQKEKTNKVSFIINKGTELCYENKNICKAFIFYKDEQYDSCYAYSNKTLLLTKKLEEKNFLNYILAYSAYRKGFYKKASASLALISNDQNYEPKKTYLLGSVYLNLKEYDKAITNFEKWETNTAIASIDEKKAMHHNLGLCYLGKKEFEKATLFFNKELSLIKKSDTLFMIRTKIDLANVYYLQYLDKQAIPLFKEAYDLAKIFSDIKLKQLTAQNMAAVERNRKRYKESVAYYLEHDKYKDSIWNRDRIWELTEKDKKIAVAQKQEEIAVQNLEIKHQKAIQKELLFGAIILLFFLGILAFFYRKLRSSNKLIIEQKEALIIANKTKDYLFSVVSHDLRSPINSIKKQHQKLAKHIANNNFSAIKEATKSAIAVTESTSHLLNNVLHWSLEQSNQLNFTKEEHVLQHIIEHVLFDYEDLVEAKNISVSSDFEEEIIVLTDKESLKIVIRNLIDNSMKYMNGSGSILINTKKYSETTAQIEIKDTGIGISKEKLQKINELKDLSIDKIDRSKGVGLGLLLCQTLIKKNNGTLFFKSEQGVGTTAIILLPLV
ncbi:ATP-binding protein [Tenacibaculum aestuariivivum]|uniref:tetratricopeptide repeat-containing sensor histidine kinase n=1 Tax=Tenacibaculum aestuariivivum TaxID=2006131 RepID=UPI003AB7218E